MKDQLIEIVNKTWQNIFFGIRGIFGSLLVQQ